MIKEIISKNLEEYIDTLFVYERSNCIELSMIKIKKDCRNQGFAREIMNNLCHYADNKGLPILLSPEPPEDESEISKSILIDFYESLGFEPNKGKIRDYSMPSHSYKRIPLY
tara:strand:+ start:9982 stop:10317 length:336 start_codon:yes stop_codon:yes gene_type:complete